MKATLTISTILSILLICTPAIAQEATLDAITASTGPPAPAILLAIPGDAYGFIATKDLQASHDNIMLFVQALGMPLPNENNLLAIQEHLGEIDLNGPAAAILLDPQKFSSKGGPIVLLFSAADAQAVFKTIQANVEATGMDEDLPAGVIKAPDGYLAVKNGFVVFAPQVDNIAAVLASQVPPQIMPAAMQAFAKGQIVLAGDLQRAAPFLIQSLDGFKAMATAQMGAAAQMPQMAMAMDIQALQLDMAKALIQQADKLTVALDINAENAIITKMILFKADSPAAAFMNAQIDQELPSYAALPGGSFLLAGASNIAPEQFNALAQTILTKLFELPSFKDKLSAEQIQQKKAALLSSNAVVSGSAFIFNLGNPMTGMLNVVTRCDVSDSALYKKLSKEQYSANTTWAQALGAPAINFVYTTAAENYSDVDIDTIKIDITASEVDPDADPQTQQMQMMMSQQMQMMPKMMFGPDMTFRLAAPNDKQVLMVIGGSGRMQRAINVAQGNGSVLADDPKIIQAATKLPAKRFAEAHLDLVQVVPMIGMFVSMMGGPPMPPAQAPEAPPISFSTSAQPNTLRADMVVPSETVGTLVQTFMGIQMQMMQQGGPGMGPQTEPSEEFEEGDF